MDTYDQHALPQHLLNTHAGDMHVSPSKGTPYEIKPKKHSVIKSVPIDDPFDLPLNVTESDSEFDNKEASSERLPKEKASSSKSAGINYCRVDM